ncbi:MAG: NADH-quinone oxidoreductase subunit J [Bdellovibrionota bacterium]|jgi:NADH-quinone oxidoreductase subunit J|nr:NADH-quinone oxidoreductase subunit J [Bdellovibrionota bacterium]
MFNDTFFLLSAGLTLAGALGVVFTKNLMHACVMLLGTLFGVAGLYACIGADFLAASQLVIYAGGVVILMLFAVMLTGGSSDQANKFGIEKIAGMGNTKTYIFAGVSVAVISLTLLKIMAGYMKTFEQGELPPLTSTVEEIGTLLVTDHVLAFEISSILLLGALVGAAAIARPRKG